MGGPAGRRDEGQPRGRRSYRHLRGDAAAAHSLLGLREKLPFLLCVALSVHIPLRCLHLNDDLSGSNWIIVNSLFEDLFFLNRFCYFYVILYKYISVFFHSCTTICLQDIALLEMSYKDFSRERRDTQKLWFSCRAFRLHDYGLSFFGL